ncbi:hypothetical protein B0H13DRAFT_2685301 [Mycena leptocephala]|nr:hypothetical protein B0H13DRAFT_2685301 [Mycena leptocephala]
MVFGCPYPILVAFVVEHGRGRGTAIPSTDRAAGSSRVDIAFSAYVLNLSYLLLVLRLRRWSHLVVPGRTIAKNDPFQRCVEIYVVKYCAYPHPSSLPLPLRDFCAHGKCVAVVLVIEVSLVVGGGCGRGARWSLAGAQHTPRRAQRPCTGASAYRRILSMRSGLVGGGGHPREAHVAGVQRAAVTLTVRCRSRMAMAYPARRLRFLFGSFSSYRPSFIHTFLVLLRSSFSFAVSLFPYSPLLPLLHALICHLLALLFKSSSPPAPTSSTPPANAVKITSDTLFILPPEDTAYQVEEEPTEMHAEGWCWWIHLSESCVRTAQCYLHFGQLTLSIHRLASLSLSAGDCILRRAGWAPGWEREVRYGEGELNASLSWQLYLHLRRSFLPIITQSVRIQAISDVRVPVPIAIGYQRPARYREQLARGLPANHGRALRGSLVWVQVRALLDPHKALDIDLRRGGIHMCWSTTCLGAAQGLARAGARREGERDGESLMMRCFAFFSSFRTCGLRRCRSVLNVRCALGTRRAALETRGYRLCISMSTASRAA